MEPVDGVEEEERPHPLVEVGAPMAEGLECGALREQLCDGGVVADRVDRLDHLVAKHVRQKGFRCLRNNVHVDFHDIGCFAHFDTVRDVRHIMRAVENCGMAVSHMRQQADLVQVMEPFADPKGRDGTALGY
jgi:hypothetical protein